MATLLLLVIYLIFGFLARTVDDFSILMYLSLILLLLMVFSHEVINRKLISRDKRLAPEEKRNMSPYRRAYAWCH